MRWFGKWKSSGSDEVAPSGNDADASTASAITTAVENIVADVPVPHTRAMAAPGEEAERVARAAAHRAALLSGSLALPPGPLGLLTVLPDIYLIWRVQRQMVSDIFSLHGRSAELTPTHMAFCLFRHLASHMLKDAAVRAGERFVVRELSRGALRSALAAGGGRVTQRVLGSAASRWLPVAGAAAVAAYAYWDTLQVAKAALRLLGSDAPFSEHRGDIVAGPSTSGP